MHLETRRVYIFKTAFTSHHVIGAYQNLYSDRHWVTWENRFLGSIQPAGAHCYCTQAYTRMVMLTDNGVYQLSLTDGGRETSVFRYS